MLGPRYALLRAEFTEALRESRLRDGSIRTILITFGGSDATNETCKTLRAISSMQEANDIDLDVVLGNANPYREEVGALCRRLPRARLHLQSDAMASLMSKADLCIGAAGISSWERCCLGLPAICWAIADNQRDGAAYLQRQGAAIHLGTREQATEATIARCLRHALQHPELVAAMGINAKGIMGQHEQTALKLIPHLISTDKARDN